MKIYQKYKLSRLKKFNKFFNLNVLRLSFLTEAIGIAKQA